MLDLEDNYFALIITKNDFDVKTFFERIRKSGIKSIFANLAGFSEHLTFRNDSGIFPTLCQLKSSPKRRASKPHQFSPT